MTMRLSEFTERLDSRLDTEAFAEHDRSPNGLQVGPREAEVEHVAFAVDAVRETAEAARAAGADVLVAHHGMIWDGLERVTGQDYGRLEPYFAGDVALYVSHLPLDDHPELGNAAGLADVLDVRDREPFGSRGPITLGCRGQFAEPTTTGEVAALLADELDPAGAGVRTLDFGPDRLEDVAVLTGLGGSWFGEAAEAGVDLFVTGESSYQLYHDAKEAGVSVVMAGHYETETFGVWRLQDLAEEWGLETTFIDAPTGF